MLNEKRIKEIKTAMCLIPSKIGELFPFYHLHVLQSSKNKVIKTAVYDNNMKFLRNWEIEHRKRDLAKR